MGTFDFDEWKHLFQNDPRAAERRRKEVIDAAIATAPPELQDKLRRLQWRIDMERERHKASPMGSCIALSKMLMDKVHGTGGLVYHLNVLCSFLQHSVRPTGTDTIVPRNASILDFPKPKGMKDESES